MALYPIPLPPGGLLPLPTVFGLTGLVQTPPATLRDTLLAIITAAVPGYTADLPGTLIEDILSTDVAAVALIDSARIELLNSLTPYGANAFILNQLGAVYGVAAGQSTNTSVNVQFTAQQYVGTQWLPIAGYVIPKGLYVSDGSYRYQVVDGGVTGSDGNSLPLYCLAEDNGTWPVPAGTVTQIGSTTPPGFSVTCLNLEPGIPGTGAETESDYRSRVLTAGLAASQGMARYLKTLLSNVPGVQSRLIGIEQNNNGTWTVICGGGDPYQVAYAIFQAMFDIAGLAGSTFNIVGIAVSGIQATVSINLNTGFIVGQAIQISGALPAGWNGNFVVYSTPSNKSFVLGHAFAANQISNLTWASGTATATMLNAHGVTPGSSFTFYGNVPTGWNGTFVAGSGTAGSTINFPLATNPGAATTFGQMQAGTAIFNATGIAAWTSGGVVTPNNRNLAINIVDFPDIYTIPFVVPPQQTVAMTVHWQTSSPNFVDAASVAQLAAPALVAYVNSVFVGQPLNLYQMQSIFQSAVANILPAYLITEINFVVSINGVGVLVDPNTGIFEGDPQSFFFTQNSSVNVVQG